ncbi:MAG: molybdate ABC transporter substrate-binding protein [Sulfurimonas sp.]|jgi:molybdate transport system substrate-binding protein
MFRKILIAFLLACGTLLSMEVQIAFLESENYATKELLAQFNSQYPAIKVKILDKSSLDINESFVYALDELVLFSNYKHDYDKGMKLLKESEIQKIFILNPSTSLYGVSAIEAMKKERVYENVKQKIVFVDSFSLEKLGENEVAIIARSLLFKQDRTKFIKNIHWMEICSKLYTPVNQSIAILKYDENNSDVKLFYDFIFSEGAEKILKDFGYTLAE